MTILIVSPYIPYPLDAGGNVAQYAVLEKLQYLATVSLCLFIYSDEQNKNADLLQGKLPLITIKKIDLRVPSTAVEGPSIMQRIKKRIGNFFRESKVTLVEPEYDEFAGHYQISPIHIKSEKIIQGLVTIFKQNTYDIVQLEYHELLELIHIIPVHSKKVFVTVESKFLRLISAYKDSTSTAEYKHYIISLNRSVESMLLKLYDAVIVFSNNDRNKLLEQRVPQVYTIPYPVPQGEFKIENDFHKIDKLIFVGGDGHAPNHDGLMWFIKECYPKIFSQFNLPLYVIGKWNSKKLSTEPGVKMLGFVEDLDSVLNNGIMIVPIRIGNGIRTKILYGMAKRIPIVTTSLGCEGIEVQDGKHVSIADSAEAFFLKISELLLDINLAKTIVDTSFNFVEENYRQEKIVSQRMQLYESLIAN
jgi:glycosyltransferase involved in cell wall biosynthesis